jgi:histidine ammonia-lyase
MTDTASFLLTGESIRLSQLAALAAGPSQVALHPDAKERMRRSRAAVEAVLQGGEAVYGINTGFGKLSESRIANEDLVRLQENLVRSHCCGLGEPLPADEVRIMLLLRANVLAKGLSGARVEVAEALLALLRQDVLPVVPSRGSVGASGDLAPLAHLALTLLGEGEAVYRGKRMLSADALQQAGIKPLQLAAKEGLALLNGTQAMTAVGGLALARGVRVVKLADVAGALTLEALMGTPAAFDERIHKARPHPGQKAVAAHLRWLMEDSQIRESHRHGDPRVQDAYSLRCMPQVHGAVRDSLEYAVHAFEIETGSATDNPLVVPAPDGFDILSGGNFHGAPIGLAMDFAAIALADLISIGERRVDRLVNPDVNEGLPPFLTREAGVSSGFMIAHVALAALLNECRVLAHPASADSTPTSGGKEDHVSMGMTSALKLRQVVANAEYALAIELIAAVEGVDFRAPLQPSAPLRQVRDAVRRIVPPLTADRVLSGDIESLAQQIREGAFDKWLEIA